MHDFRDLVCTETDIVAQCTFGLCIMLYVDQRVITLNADKSGNFDLKNRSDVRDFLIYKNL